MHEDEFKIRACPIIKEFWPSLFTEHQMAAWYQWLRGYKVDDVVMAIKYLYHVRGRRSPALVDVTAYFKQNAIHPIRLTPMAAPIVSEVQSLCRLYRRRFPDMAGMDDDTIVGIVDAEERTKCRESCRLDPRHSPWYWSIGGHTYRHVVTNADLTTELYRLSRNGEYPPALAEPTTQSELL